jgi:hypothetical protein
MMRWAMDDRRSETSDRRFTLNSISQGEGGTLADAVYSLHNFEKKASKNPNNSAKVDHPSRMKMRFPWSPSR